MYAQPVGRSVVVSVTLDERVVAANRAGRNSTAIGAPRQTIELETVRACGFRTTLCQAK